MSPTWEGDPPPEPASLGIAGMIRLGLKGGLLAIVIAAGFAALFVARIAERLLLGEGRAWSAGIIQTTYRAALGVIGLRLHREGTVLAGPGAFVANHASWLDIFVLGASAPVTFVAKSEVAVWPLIGWMARGAGTVFIRRDRRDAEHQRHTLAQHAASGRKLLFFPEGTSTDGRRVLAFKPTLFAAFFEPGIPDGFAVQPVSLVYHAPDGADPRFYGWWGDMGFGAHLARTLATSRQGSVSVVFHPPVPVALQPHRKSLASATEKAVRSGVAGG